MNPESLAKQGWYAPLLGGKMSNKCEHNHSCNATAKFSITTGHITNPLNMKVCAAGAIEMMVEDAFKVSDFDSLDGAVIDGMDPLDWLKTMTSE